MLRRKILHIACHSRVFVDPPCPANAGLPVKKAELVKTELFLKTATHSNAGFSSAYDGHRIICVALCIMSFFGDPIAINLKTVSWISFLYGVVSLPSPNDWGLTKS
jgi:hypothetical protein